MRKNLILSFLVLFTFSAFSSPGDTTWVNTYNQEYFNWATTHQDTFNFPTEEKDYAKVILHYRIECPQAGCDPWDRLGNIKVRVPTGIMDSNVAGIDTLTGDTTWNVFEVVESYEIARIITPYSIGNRSCTWQIDVTDYQFLLKGDVWMSIYISTWIGDNRGWLVTVDFEFIEGWPQLVPFKIVNLWNSGGRVVGDPSRPIEDFLTSLTPDIDIEADSIKFRMITTGHGQGNTQNAAEFSRLDHMIIVEGDTFSNDLWRSDCAQNPCSPQGGNWQPGRAGWCPGDKVNAWDIVEINNYYTPGQPLMINYDLEPYENFCRPDASCIPNQHCPGNDCNYNNTGHTQPNYAIETQLILYRDSVDNYSAIGAPSFHRNFSLFPNPADGLVYVTLEKPNTETFSAKVFDISGALVYLSRVPARKELSLDLSSLTAGMYFVAVRIEGKTSVQKLLVK